MSDHIIQRQVIEVQMESKQDAFRLQHEITSLIRTKLLPRINQVFERYDVPDSVIRLERIVLDLGRIHNGNFGRAFEAVFIQCLEEQLSAKIDELEISSKGKDSNTLIPLSKSKLELFRLFLENGVVPWWAKKRKLPSIVAVLEDLLEENKEELVLYLKNIANKKYVFKRLVEQFPQHQIQQIIQHLLSKSYQTVHSFIQQIEQQLALSKNNETAFHRQLNLVVLQYLLQEKTTRVKIENLEKEIQVYVQKKYKKNIENLRQKTAKKSTTLEQLKLFLGQGIFRKEDGKNSTLESFFLNIIENKGEAWRFLRTAVVENSTAAKRVAYQLASQTLSVLFQELAGKQYQKFHRFQQTLWQVYEQHGEKLNFNDYAAFKNYIHHLILPFLAKKNHDFSVRELQQYLGKAISQSQNIGQTEAQVLILSDAATNRNNNTLLLLELFSEYLKYSVWKQQKIVVEEVIQELVFHHTEQFIVFLKKEWKGSMNTKWLAHLSASLLEILFQKTVPTNAPIVFQFYQSVLTRFKNNQISIEETLVKKIVLEGVLIPTNFNLSTFKKNVSTTLLKSLAVVTPKAQTRLFPEVETETEAISEIRSVIEAIVHFLKYGILIPLEGKEALVTFEDYFEEGLINQPIALLNALNTLPIDIVSQRVAQQLPIDLQSQLLLVMQPELHEDILKIIDVLKTNLTPQLELSVAIIERAIYQLLYQKLLEAAAATIKEIVTFLELEILTIFPTVSFDVVILRDFLEIKKNKNKLEEKVENKSFGILKNYFQNALLPKDFTKEHLETLLLEALEEDSEAIRLQIFSLFLPVLVEKISERTLQAILQTIWKTTYQTIEPLQKTLREWYRQGGFTGTEKVFVWQPVLAYWMIHTEKAVNIEFLKDFVIKEIAATYHLDMAVAKLQLSEIIENKNKIFTAAFNSKVSILKAYFEKGTLPLGFQKETIVQFLFLLLKKEPQKLRFVLFSEHLPQIIQRLSAVNLQEIISIVWKSKAAEIAKIEKKLGQTYEQKQIKGTKKAFIWYPLLNYWLVNYSAEIDIKALKQFVGEEIKNNYGIVLEALFEQLSASNKTEDIVSQLTILKTYFKDQIIPEGYSKRKVEDLIIPLLKKHPQQLRLVVFSDYLLQIIQLLPEALLIRIIEVIWEGKETEVKQLRLGLEKWYRQGSFTGTEKVFVWQPVLAYWMIHTEKAVNIEFLKDFVIKEIAATYHLDTAVAKLQLSEIIENKNKISTAAFNSKVSILKAYFEKGTLPLGFQKETIVQFLFLLLKKEPQKLRFVLFSEHLPQIIQRLSAVNLQEIISIVWESKAAEIAKIEKKLGQTYEQKQIKGTKKAFIWYPLLNYWLVNYSAEIDLKALKQFVGEEIKNNYGIVLEALFEQLSASNKTEDAVSQLTILKTYFKDQTIPEGYSKRKVEGLIIPLLKKHPQQLRLVVFSDYLPQIIQLLPEALLIRIIEVIWEGKETEVKQLRVGLERWYHKSNFKGTVKFFVWQPLLNYWVTSFSSVFEIEQVKDFVIEEVIRNYGVSKTMTIAALAEIIAKPKTATKSYDNRQISLVQNYFKDGKLPLGFQPRTIEQLLLKLIEKSPISVAEQLFTKHLLVVIQKLEVAELWNIAETIWKNGQVEVKEYHGILKTWYKEESFNATEKVFVWHTLLKFWVEMPTTFFDKEDFEVFVIAELSETYHLPFGNVMDSLTRISSTYDRETVGIISLNEKINTLNTYFFNSNVAQKTTQKEIEEILLELGIREPKRLRIAVFAKNVLAVIKKMDERFLYRLAQKIWKNKTTALEIICQILERWHKESKLKGSVKMFVWQPIFNYWVVKNEVFDFAIVSDFVIEETVRNYGISLQKASETFVALTKFYEDKSFVQSFIKRQAIGEPVDYQMTVIESFLELGQIPSQITKKQIFEWFLKLAANNLDWLHLSIFERYLVEIIEIFPDTILTKLVNQLWKGQNNVLQSTRTLLKKWYQKEEFDATEHFFTWHPLLNYWYEYPQQSFELEDFHIYLVDEIATFYDLSPQLVLEQFSEISNDGKPFDLATSLETLNEMLEETPKQATEATQRNIITTYLQNKTVPKGWTTNKIYDILIELAEKESKSLKAIFIKVGIEKIVAALPEKVLEKWSLTIWKGYQGFVFVVQKILKIWYQQGNVSEKKMVFLWTSNINFWLEGRRFEPTRFLEFVVEDLAERLGKNKVHIFQNIQSVATTESQKSAPIYMPLLDVLETLQENNNFWETSQQTDTATPIIDYDLLFIAYFENKPLPSSHSHSEVQALFREQFLGRPYKFLSLLKPQYIAVFISAYSDTALMDFVKSVVASYAGLVDTVQILLKEWLKKANLGVEEKVFTWMAIWGYLIENQKQRFDVTIFIKSVIKENIFHYDLDSEKTINELVNIVERKIDSGLSRFYPVVEVLQVLAEEAEEEGFYIEKMVDDALMKSYVEPSKLAILKAFLEQKAYTTEEEIEKLMESMLKEDSSLLFKTIEKHHLPLVVTTVSPALLMDLAVHHAPQERSFFITLTKALKVWYNSGAKVFRIKEAIFIWQPILQYHWETSKSYNRSDFIQYIVQKIIEIVWIKQDFNQAIRNLYDIVNNIGQQATFAALLKELEALVEIDYEAEGEAMVAAMLAEEMMEDQTVLSQLDLIETYLNEGIVLDKFKNWTRPQLEQVFRELLEKSPIVLIERLRTTGVKRLARQFSIKTLELLLKNSTDYIFPFAKKLKPLLKRYYRTAGLSITEREFVWQSLLEYPITEYYSKIEEKAYLTFIFKTIAQTKQTSFEAVVASWLEVIGEEQARESAYYEELLEEVTEIKKESQNTISKTTKKATNAVEELKTIFEHVAFSTIEFEKTLIKALEQESKKVKDLLFTVNFSAAVLEKMISQLRDETLIRLVNILHPSVCGFMGTVVETVEQLCYQHPKAFIAVTSVHGLKWQAVLEYGLTARKIETKTLVENTIKYLSTYLHLEQNIVIEEFIQISKKGKETGNQRYYPLYDVVVGFQKSKKKGKTVLSKEEKVNTLVIDFFRNQNKNEYPEFEKQFLIVVRQNKLWSRSMLLEVLRDYDYIEWIVETFSEKAMDALIQLMQPHQSEKIKRYAQDLAKILSDDFVWKQLLLHLYTINEAAFDVPLFIKVLFENYTNTKQAYHKLLHASILFVENTALPTKQALLEIFADFQRDRRIAAKKKLKAEKYRKLGERASGEKIYVNNAGLVLVWPFLTRYFSMLGMTTILNKFKTDADRERAVHLLQFVVNGETATPEHELVLNKILCGVPLVQPVPAEIQITQKEIDITHQLINAALANWEKMKSLTISNLRGSFLIREGSVEETTLNWIVQVKQEPYDMLLDSLPWGLSLVQLPWMDKRLKIEWR